MPIRFSLRGFRGPRPEAEAIRAPRAAGGDSQQVARANAHASKKQPMFKYLPRSDEYVMCWKTDHKWTGSCREFVLQLDDGSIHPARFQFTKNPNR